MDNGHTHTIKGLRGQFKAQGKFHTPPELVATIAALAKSQLDGDPKDVYDPTCGAGDLLSAFPNVPKYGQDIDAEAVEDATRNLDNFHGVVGDVLADPAWIDRKFHLIVANPPFSIKWTPHMDERFEDAPTIPTQSKADYAFILHIVHMLADDGVAVVMGFPGILYRGGREGKIRRWLVEQNLISHVVAIPGGKFEDTAIATCVLIIQKCRRMAGVQFIDMEHEIEKWVPRKEIEANDFNLSVAQYAAPEVVKEVIDPVELNRLAWQVALRKMRGEMNFQQQVCELEGWDFTPYWQSARAEIDKFAPKLQEVTV